MSQSDTENLPVWQSHNSLTAIGLAECFEDRGNIKALEALGGIQTLVKNLQTDLKKGITSTEHEDNWRRTTFGTNELPERKYSTLLELFIEALKDTTLIILCVAAAISLTLGLAFPDEAEGQTRATGWIEGASILLAVLLVSSVNAINNWEKDKQFRVLEKAKNNDAVFVIRDGEVSQIKTFDLMVGDIVQLQRGDSIPADGIMISGKEVTVDQANLTGEPQPIHKDTKEDPFLLSGCIMSDGDARMLVMAVGVNSCWGKIQADLEQEDSQTPLQESLEELAKRIGYFGLISAIIVFIVLTLWWISQRWIVKDVKFQPADLEDFVQFFIIAVTIVVVAVPEGLPLAVTISLAYSMQKMMKDNNLVRHLQACETMGGVTNICTDKTGTLTENRMAVVRGFITQVNLQQLSNPKTIALVNQAVAVNSKASLKQKLTGQWEYLGNKTECALLVLTKKFGGDYVALREQFPPLKQFNFSSERKRMTTVVDLAEEGVYRLHCKGAPEMVLQLCSKVMQADGSLASITEEDKAQVMSMISEFSKQGLRTLALCYKDMPSDLSQLEVAAEQLETDLIFIGVFGIEDPLRPEVIEAVKQCKRAGIVVRMVTGDNIETARKIATECGILTSDDVAMEGSDFRKSSPDDITLLKKLRVVARSSPQDKKLLVGRLKAFNEVVAVTGDGTNDAPALSEAHVGLAMGIEGTGVAKQASDIIIMDDNFASIVKAVMWGRNVRENIQKFLQFQLTVNVVALTVAVIAAVTGQGTPLKAIQLLWVNLIMDTLGALALGTEAPTPALLDRPPVGKNYPLINALMWRSILLGGLYQLIVLFVLLYSGHEMIGTTQGSRRHYTLLFNAFVFCQIFNEINARRINQGEYNVFKGLLSSYIFMGVIIFIAVVQVILVEFGGDAIMTAPLQGTDWIISICFGAGTLIWGFLIRFAPAPEILCCKVREGLLEDGTEQHRLIE